MNRDHSTDSRKTSAHLTTEQLGEILDATLGGDSGAGLAAARTHLESCETCRSEFDSMREAIALFRESTAAFARQEFTSQPRNRVDTSRMLSHTGRAFSPSFAWAAAALLLGAAILPMRFHHQQQDQPAITAATNADSASPSPAKGESDAALLDDINRDLSASIPDSMEPLADPASSPGTDAASAMTRKN